MIIIVSTLKAFLVMKNTMKNSIENDSKLITGSITLPIHMLLLFGGTNIVAEC